LLWLVLSNRVDLHALKLRDQLWDGDVALIALQARSKLPL